MSLGKQEDRDKNLRVWGALVGVLLLPVLGPIPMLVLFVAGLVLDVWSLD
jgi:hypothetical protein